MLDAEKRILELAERSVREQRYIFSDFMGMSELAVYYALRDGRRAPELAGTQAFGGIADAERCLIRFGDKELLGYEEDYPIALIRVRPVRQKFADTLSHRDFLGSVLGLGLEREKTGDIFIRENEGYIFVLESIADYILANLEYVKHTKVKTDRCRDIPEGLVRKLEEMQLIVSSNRIDAIVAKLYRISREEALKLFHEERVYLNGRPLSRNAKGLTEGDVISVRGYGRFTFLGEGGNTKKEHLYVHLGVYV